MKIPSCLTIAGSDSGGNAGIQADLRTFHAYKVHGCSVIAALTAQNPFDVSAIHNVPADFVGAQLDAVLGVYDIRALKTGMLAGARTIETVAEKLRHFPGIIKTVDPVMVATSGAALISDGAAEALEKNLLCLADVITPNVPEAKKLSGMEINSVESAADAARSLYDRYGAAVVIKGGHLKGPAAADIVFDGDSVRTYCSPWIENPVSTHGSGCTFAAALTAEFALGRKLDEAVANAKAHVHEVIVKSAMVGENCGVLGFADGRLPRQGL